MKRIKKSTQIIAVHSLSHMAVDFICILSLMHSFSQDAQMILLYNFTAFALQLPIGQVLDQLSQKHPGQRIPLFAAFAGMALCIIGSFVSPVISGFGNALFHTGAGMICMDCDEADQLEGRGLGVFVAPGALGVTAGILLASTQLYAAVRIVLCIVLALLCIGALYIHKDYEIQLRAADQQIHTDDLRVSMLCLAAVILRSVCGTSLVFPWRNGVMYVILSTIALAAGKAAGGFLCARLNLRKAVIISLYGAAICYQFSNQPLFGLAALFFFNMSMPLTLYTEMKNRPAQHGFAFGLLTFGLFLGYLPAFYGIYKNVNAAMPGTIISLSSLILLVIAETLRQRES